MCPYKNEERGKTLWGKSSLKNGQDTYMIKISLMDHLLHMNDLNEQLLGDRLGEDVVDAKIMHQCINVL